MVEFGNAVVVPHELQIERRDPAVEIGFGKRTELHQKFVVRFGKAGLLFREAAHLLDLFLGPVGKEGLAVGRVGLVDGKADGLVFREAIGEHGRGVEIGVAPRLARLIHAIADVGDLILRCDMVFLALDMILRGEY